MFVRAPWLPDWPVQRNSPTGLAFLSVSADIPPRKAGGRVSRQPGQIRKEAATTSFGAGRFSLPPHFWASSLPGFAIARSLIFPDQPRPL